MIKNILKIKKLNWALLAILTLALLLRIPFLNGSFWLDESAQALEGIRPLSQQLDIVPDFQPPLLHFITHFASQFSHQEWWLRLFGALIPGIITVYATYKIGEILFDKKTAFIASLMLATSSFHIFFSQELRPYSLPAMWALLSWLELIKLSFKPKNYHGSFFTLSFYSAMGLYSSYLYPFHIISQLIYIFLKEKKHIKTYLLAFGSSIVSFLPWMPMFFKQLNAGQLLRTQMPGWEKIVSIPQLKAPLLVIGKLIFGIINIDINFIFITTSITIFGLSIFIFNKKYKFSTKKQKKSWQLLLIWVLIPLITSWLVSFIVPVVRPKRLLFLQSGIYLFFANLATLDSKKILFSKWIQNLLIIIILMINIFSLYQLYTNPHYQREDWRALHSKVQSQFPLQDTVLVFSFTEAFSPWVWYDQREYKTIFTGVYYIDDAPNLVQTLKPITNYNYVLVFDYLRDLTDPNDKLIEEIEAFGYKGIGVIDYPNIGFVRIYVKPGITFS